MKITIIHGQAHQEASYHLGRYLLQSLPCDTISEYFLPKDLPAFCCGCYRCLNIGMHACPHAKSILVIQQAILKSDLLIVTTPTYCLHTSGSMKAFLDHCFTWWMPHQPRAELFHTRAVIIATAAGAGMKGSVKDIKDSLRYWGISAIKSVKVQTAASSWESMPEQKKVSAYHKLDQIATYLQSNKGKCKVSIRTKALFLIMRFMQKKQLSTPQDYAYWEDKGWLSHKRPWR